MPKILEILTIYFSAIILAEFVFFLHFLYHRKFGLPTLTFKDSLDNITPELKKYLFNLRRNKDK
jgi:hypothetical protein